MVGVRIICHYVEDIDVVADMISQEFRVDPVLSVDKRTALAPDQFGYLSSHYIVTLGTSRRRLPEWKMFACINAEIQIRTILQHAWAAINHKLTYKTSQDVPSEVMRETFRLSALLELADQEFARLRDRIAAVRASYDKSIEEGHLDLELNRDSFDQFIASTDIVSKWTQLGLEAGAHNAGVPEFALVNDDIGRRRLFLVLQALGVRTVKEFTKVLDDAERGGLSNLSRFHKRSAELGYQPHAWPYDVMAMAIAVDRAADLPRSFRFGFQHAELDRALSEMLSEGRP